MIPKAWHLSFLALTNFPSLQTSSIKVCLIINFISTSAGVLCTLWISIDQIFLWVDRIRWIFELWLNSIILFPIFFSITIVSIWMLKNNWSFVSLFNSRNCELKWVKSIYLYFAKIMKRLVKSDAHLVQDSYGYQ